ncbi:MAG: ABC transporter ATP-binding protein [Candidatus Rhabdochlamydia sp.]|jgi:lipoprotein-releasing system ATP-binding protein|nr:lipoprotein-releasing system ATP-binding protein [Chlamydiota bacterium]
MTVLIAKNLKKSFSSPHQIELLKGINLTISHQESLAIVGKSGAGKSTLMHILGTLDTPSEGELIINGVNTEEANCYTIRKKKLGFVFQSHYLLENYSVIENVILPAKIARMRFNKQKLGLRLLSAVGLLEHAYLPVKFLSGGEKQRLAIARALCNNPDLILADEPTGSLDSFHAEMVYDLLLRLVKEQGKSIVIVTHDLKAAHLCDRMLILKDGFLSEVTNTINL